MPFSYSIKPKEKETLVIAEGQVDIRSSLDAIQSVARDPDFQPSFHVTVDMRKMEYTASVGDLPFLIQSLTSYKNTFNGGITLVYRSKHLHLANMISTLARVWGLNFQIEIDWDESK